MVRYIKWFLCAYYVFGMKPPSLYYSLQFILDRTFWTEWLRLDQILPIACKWALVGLETWEVLFFSGLQTAIYVSTGRRISKFQIHSPILPDFLKQQSQTTKINLFDLNNMELKLISDWLVFTDSNYSWM